MGTSGEYGGSSSAAWKQARDAWLELLASDGEGAVSKAATSAAHAVGGSAKGGDSASPTAGGRSGRAARLVAGARSGGRAIAAAYAYDQGDADTLAGLGLDLAELQAMSLKQRCQAILDATMAAVDQPDDVAMRRAALAILKDMLGTDAMPAAIDAVKAFLVNYIFEIALVEVARTRQESRLTASELSLREKRARDYLRKRVDALDLSLDGASVAPSALSDAMARLLPVVTAIVGGPE